MTKKGRTPGFGLYFMAIILLLAAYYIFYGTMGTTSVTYAQVQELFREIGRASCRERVFC